ncbi:MAG TPA: copper resistance CopC family protein, partial [Steroidobacteraceae bacterium]
MRPGRSFGGWLLVVWAAGTTCAQAHAHLQASIPRDGSVLGTSPAALVLQFSEAARLTALWIEQSGGTKQRLTPLPREPQTKIAVPLPKLAPGEYVVSWRVLGGDGH